MTIQRPQSKQPIPEDAKKVFSGKIFDVYQWEQALFNGKKIIFEKIKRTDTVNVIPITKNGKIILSEQEQPGTKKFIGVLGGRIDKGESPLNAAKRELLEEAGIEAKEFIFWYAVQPIEKIDWAIYTFIAKDCHKVAEQSPDAGEKIKLIEVVFDEFIKITTQENYRDNEIALRLYRTINNKVKFEEARNLFL